MPSSKQIARWRLRRFVFVLLLSVAALHLTSNSVRILLVKQHPNTFIRRDLFSTNTSGKSTSGKPVSFAMAYRDSMGFFYDIPDSLWIKQKKISLNREHHHYWYEPFANLNKPAVWYQENWDPDFSCPAEDKIGRAGDGHKWVCDPHRIEQISRQNLAIGKPGCLVYSIGSSGLFDFEQDVQKSMPSCEIHTFDFTDYRYKMPKNLNISYHIWGLKPSYQEEIPDQPGKIRASFQNNAWNKSSTTVVPKTPREAMMNSRTSVFKTIQETMKELGHLNRRVDIFKIDCEGCEWVSYKDWIRHVDIRQLQIEVHDTPAMAVDFFQTLHDNNFVMFHKEPNIQYSGGSCVEFSFLKMADSFFKNETQIASST